MCFKAGFVEHSHNDHEMRSNSICAQWTHESFSALTCGYCHLLNQTFYLKVTLKPCLCEFKILENSMLFRLKCLRKVGTRRFSFGSVIHLSVRKQTSNHYLTTFIFFYI